LLSNYKCVNKQVKKHQKYLNSKANKNKLEIYVNAYPEKISEWFVMKVFWRQKEI